MGYKSDITTYVVMKKRERGPKKLPVLSFWHVNFYVITRGRKTECFVSIEVTYMNFARHNDRDRARVIERPEDIICVQCLY